MLTVSELDPPEVEQWLAGAAGTLAFDVGANVGRVAGELCGRFKRVVAFEPAHESYAALSHLAYDQHPNMSPSPYAISDRVGSVKLAEQASHIRKGQLTSPEDGGEEWSRIGGGWGKVVGHRIVPSLTLDVAMRIFGEPDLVKIDVEGHEERVVRGGEVLWETVRPHFYIEVHNRERGDAIAAQLGPIYPDMREITHPGYGPGEFGHRNHYWLVSGDPT